MNFDNSYNILKANPASDVCLLSFFKVHGCMDFLNTAIFGVSRDKNITTQEVFNFLLRSFHTAHTLILQEEAQLTTLTACVILPIEDIEEKGILDRVLNIKYQLE